MNENKIPCGGFRIGDGLAMDGDTLKSLGGAYVKVNTNDLKTFEFMDDSPLKTFEEIVRKIATSLVTLIVHYDNIPFCPSYLSDITEDAIIFSQFDIVQSKLVAKRFIIDSNNKIIFSDSVYTLTPAT